MELSKAIECTKTSMFLRMFFVLIRTKTEEQIELFEWANTPIIQTPDSWKRQKVC